jgi:hypothetical protein
MSTHYVLSIFIKFRVFNIFAMRIGVLIMTSLLKLYRNYKACPSDSGTEVGAPLFPEVELCDFSGRWQCMSGEI